MKKTTEDTPIWEIIQHEFINLGKESIVKKEFSSIILSKYPHIKKGTLSAQIAIQVINKRSRTNYNQCGKERVCGDNKFDFLFEQEDKTLCKYDKSKHAIWEIYKRDDGKLDVRIVSNDSLKLLTAIERDQEEEDDTTKFFEKANETLQQPAILQEISGDAQLEKIKKILNDDSSQINAKDSRQGMEGYTALHYACWDAKTDIAKYLIEQGADVHVKGTKDNATALLLCNTNTAQFECAKMLIDAGVNLEERLIEENPYSPKYPTALRLAVINQAWETVDLLIEKGASLAILQEPCKEQTHGTTDFFENCRYVGIEYYPDRHDEDRINALEKYCMDHDFN